MKLKFVTAIALCAMAILSCDEDTGTIGDSLTDESNKLVVTTQNFDILTKSMPVESVYSRERQCYVGKVLDPETGTYVKSEFTTQFNMMEQTAEDMPKMEDLLLNEKGEIVADSSFIMVYFDVPSSYGDSLATMKLRMSELSKPITGASTRYTNFDVKSSGYLRENGYKKDLVFSIRDLTRTDSVRYLIDTNLHRTSNTSDNGWYDCMRIWLTDPYTDKNGKTYPDYATYVLRSFYDHPEYFKNTYTFINNVCPGFHFETVDGIGVMARVKEISMYIFYHYIKDGQTSAISYLMTTSTEEVVQTSTVTNDNAAISSLVADNSCTYIKSPAAIFTEVELPIDNICTTHPNDSILSAKVSFQRINNSNDAPEKAFATPSKLLLIEKDSLNSFFVKNSTFNNTFAYQASLSSNAYTYSNVSNLITRMYNSKVKGLKSDPNWTANHPDWNKAVLVPIEEVTVTSSSYSTSTASTIALKNKMGLSSTRLIKGTSALPIKMEVIYAKFKE